MHLKDKENLLSLKRFSKEKVKKLGKEAQVLKERNLMKNVIKASAFVPEILCTCVDQTFAAILLNTILACPISSLLHSPLDESSARFITASLVSALEDIHKVKTVSLTFPVISKISWSKTLFFFFPFLLLLEFLERYSLQRFIPRVTDVGSIRISTGLCFCITWFIQFHIHYFHQIIILISLL